MKTLALYTILLGAGAMTLYSHLTNDRQNFYAPLQTIELEMSAELIDKAPIQILTVSPTLTISEPNEYHIYYENRSAQSIDVAIRYKTIEGKWKTRGLETLEPGEEKLMGLSLEKTYYMYAQGTKILKRKKWEGAHSFPITPNTKRNIKFKKREIWECYDTQMCKTIAVFK